jgi:pyruvate kinase
VELEIDSKSDPTVIARVIAEGKIKVGKSINLPDQPLRSVNSAITDQDREDLGERFDVDIVAESFVRDPTDVGTLSVILDGHYRDDPSYLRPQIVAKIETAEAVRRGVDPGTGTERDIFLEILRAPATFGVMIARGDLGGELGIAKVPALQERLLNYANRMGKPAIVATQMLESMTDSPVPTRAEAEDIWSAVMEGADAVMLSGETANGRYPQPAVKKMYEILSEAKLNPESYRLKFEGDFVFGRLRPLGSLPQFAVDVIGYAIVSTAEGAKSPFIVTYATKGWSAARISRFRPKEPIRILALTLQPRIARILRLLYGVCPVLLTRNDDSGGDLPRDQGDALRLTRYVINEVTSRSKRFSDALDSDWRTRFSVATLAEEKPEVDWDKSRALLVFQPGPSAQPST